MLHSNEESPLQKDIPSLPTATPNQATYEKNSESCSISIQSISSISCRICQNTDGNDRLISPCLCKGTMAYVHRSCLERWFRTSGLVHCELCLDRYPTEETLRYTLCQSIRIWYRHPNNRGLLQADIVICSLLTLVTLSLVAICMFGVYYFGWHSVRLGMSRSWTQGAMIVFLVIVILGYSTNLFLLVKSQMVPWYRWWQSARTIKLVVVDRSKMNPSESKPFDKKLKKSAIARVEREIQSTFMSSSASQQQQQEESSTPTITDEDTSHAIGPSAHTVVLMH